MGSGVWVQPHGNGREDMLVVCPTNVLCDEIQNYKTVTVHTLMGKRPQGTEDDTDFNKFDVSEYNVVLFEENNILLFD